ncbi:MAG: ThiF family adenylyltransferase, partial [Planctomycetaceae bacterium]|nr:ThiF family adenylyltransferase [Planctomycetaceae bacterium]
ALQLASLGIPRLQLIDFDHVEETNITTQGYLQRDLGLSKVDATSRMISDIDPSIEVETIADRYRPQITLAPVVFCCVDSITSRSAIWRNARQQTLFWCDGRMLGEVMRIITAADEESREAYADTLFHREEAEQGSCTSRGVIYTAAIAAGLVLHQFTRWLRDLPLERDFSLNL